MLFFRMMVESVKKIDVQNQWHTTIIIRHFRCSRARADDRGVRSTFNRAESNRPEQHGDKTEMKKKNKQTNKYREIATQSINIQICTRYESTTHG